MKLILLALIFSSCATKMPEKKPVRTFKTRQELIIDCYSYVKTLGANDKFAGNFCTEIYGGE